MPDKKKPRILFVDDDMVTCRVMERNCDNANYDCRVFQDPRACLERFEAEGADLVITDLRMPGMTGFDLLSRLRDIDTEVPVLVMTGYSSVENAVEAMKRGATDFIKKPFDFTELRLLMERALKNARLRAENRLLRRRLGDGGNHYGMIGDTPAMKRLFATIDKVAEVSCSVVVTGESGTGKELVARALHDHGPRRDKPFVAVDCGREGGIHRRDPAQDRAHGAGRRRNPVPRRDLQHLRYHADQTDAFPWTCVSSLPAIATWNGWSKRANSGTISSTGSMWSTSMFRPCLSDARTFPP